MSRPTPSATESLGAALASAIATHDEPALLALFATPCDFRAVTPRRFWDADTPPGVADIVLGTWFAPPKTVTGVDLVEDDIVGDASRITYRLSVATPDGPTVIEQIAYYDTAHTRITKLRLVCSGFRPVG
jgi:hypothetical protein